MLQKGDVSLLFLLGNERLKSRWACVRWRRDRVEDNGRHAEGFVLIRGFRLAGSSLVSMIILMDCKLNTILDFSPSLDKRILRQR